MNRVSSSLYRGAILTAMLSLACGVADQKKLLLRHPRHRHRRRKPLAQLSRCKLTQLPSTPAIRRL